MAEFDNSNLSLSVLVPSNIAGALIGKGGQGLISIREMSQCQVQLRREPDARGNRRCDIQGPTVEHIASATHAIACRLFPEGASDCSMTLSIPQSYAGGVIGKGGENLKRVREQTGVRLQMDRENIGEGGDRIASLVGDQRQLGAAIRVAYNGIASANHGIAPGGRGGRGGHAQAMAQPYQTPYYAQHGHGAPMTRQMPHAAPVPPPATVTAVRRFSGDVNDVQLHMSVPPKFIGAILGKEGSEIKRVLAESNCTNVSVTKREAGPDRRVVIMGGLEDCVRAQSMVYNMYTTAAQAAGEDVSDVSVIFMVPQACAGAVIGKEGANLKRIREQASAKVKLEREEVEGYRPCLLQGAFDAVLSAERLIQEQVVTEGAEALSNGQGKRRAEFMDGAMDAPYQNQSQEAKRPRMAVAQDHGSSKLLVPGRAAGAVIGKQGSTLKQMRESTGAQIEVVPQERTMHFPQERVVILKGNLACRSAAMTQVLQAAFERDGQGVFLKMLVSSGAAGGVIGRQGSNLKAIRETSGLNVQVEREEIAGERMVTANGPMEAVLNAAHMVMESAEAPAGGKGGAGQPVPTAAY
eukprot:gb/GFBE01079095.1/.p1 GENE.gb/GFBE01079095.1/~~gb/GFBE01079095.1/.p1  ORF type:complete len:580 (+),score=132.60 gb/GFBE01079095.1/:1-1740(+)